MTQPTEAQKAARERNWYILQSLHIMSGFILNEDRRLKIQFIIDQEIQSLGAQTQMERNALRRQMMNEGDYEGLDAFEKKHGFKRKWKKPGFD